MDPEPNERYVERKREREGERGVWGLGFHIKCNYLAPFKAYPGQCFVVVWVCSGMFGMRL